MYCPQCGKPNADDARFCTNCGTALTAAAVPAEAPRSAARTAPTVYAGFWRRAAALSIDGLILSVPSGIVFTVFFLPTISAIVSNVGDQERIVSLVLASIFGWVWLGMLIFAIRILYFALFESSRFQATPGKLALGLVVTDMQGQSVSFLRALGRNLGKILSKAIFMIGFIMAGLTDKKQALHDLLADTLVIVR